MNLHEKVLNVSTLLEQIGQRYLPAAFANSFGAEDVVMTDLIARHAPGIEIFTLDTGRLPEPTHALMRELADRYDLPIRVFYPDGAELEAFTAAHGANAFFDSVELRKGVLRSAQGASLAACACRQACMDHRSATGAKPHACGDCGERVRSGARTPEVQPLGRLDAQGGVGVHPRA